MGWKSKSNWSSQVSFQGLFGKALNFDFSRCRFRSQCPFRVSSFRKRAVLEPNQKSRNHDSESLLKSFRRCLDHFLDFDNIPLGLLLLYLCHQFHVLEIVCNSKSVLLQGHPGHNLDGFCFHGHPGPMVPCLP